MIGVLRRNRLKALAVAAALALAGLVVWGLLAPHRDPRVEAVRKQGYPATLGELDAWYRAVPPTENVALAYTQAFALLAGGSASRMGTSLSRLSEILPARGQALTAEDKGKLAELLAANEGALRLLDSAPASGRSR